MSNSETYVIRIIDCIILKSFNLLMTSSMWILTFDIFRDFSTSYAAICDFPQVKCGIVRKAPYVANSSSIVNPLFARTCCNFSKKLASNCEFFIRYPAYPALWKKVDSTSRCYAYQIFNIVMMFAIRPSLGLCC